MPTIQEIEDACSRAEPLPCDDPVLAHAEFPLRRTFYPMGFPMEIATNSQEILNATSQSWCGYTKLFDTETIRVQVGVREGKSSECPPAPTCRVQQGTMSNIADGENYSLYDMVRGVCSVWVTPAAVAHRSYLRYFFLESPVLCQLAMRYATAVHAACVEQDGVGILLCGDSGAGKSTLSYACALAGWTYITDDASFLVQGREDRMVVGNCNQVRFRPSATQFFPELDGMEITQRAEIGKPSLELCTTPFKHLKRSLSANVDYIVFLNRRDPSRQELRPYSKKVAGYFMRQVQFGTAEVVERQNAAIDRLLEAEVLELRYQDLGWAIKQLGQLVREKRR